MLANQRNWRAVKRFETTALRFESRDFDRLNTNDLASLTSVLFRADLKWN